MPEPQVERREPPNINNSLKGHYLIAAFDRIGLERFAGTPERYRTLLQAASYEDWLGCMSILNGLIRSDDLKAVTPSGPIEAEDRRVVVGLLWSRVTTLRLLSSDRNIKACCRDGCSHTE